MWPSPTAKIRRWLPTVIATSVAALIVGTLDAAPASAAGSVTFKNRLTTYCLDSNYHDPSQGNPEQGAVYSQKCNGGNYQNWHVNLTSGGVNIVDAQTGKCLDSDYGGNIYSLPCNGGTYQKWHIYDTGSRGYVAIADAQTGFCLDTGTAFPVYGSIYTTKCNGGHTQSWQ